MSEFLNRKKELLKKREALLVEIGMDILKNASLPEGHHNLPRDIDRTNQMMQERKKRLELAEAERNTQELHHSTLKSTLEDLKNKAQKEIESLENQLQSSHPDSPEYTKIQSNYSKRRDELTGRRQELEERLEEAERALRTTASEIDDIKSAMDLLEETKIKRLRDLAYDFIQKNKSNSLFATKFAHYRLIQLELQELNAPEKPAKGLSQIVDERKKLSWLWIPSAILASLLVFLLIRNEFSQKSTSFSALCQAIDLVPGEKRILFQEEHANLYLIEEAANALQLAAGIELLKDEASLPGYSQLLFSIAENGDLAFLAIDFKAPVSDWEKTFQSKGWIRKKNHWGVEAFYLNQWAWYQLTPKQFMCYPSNQDLPVLPTTEENDLSLLVHTELPTFDLSHPLTAGYSELHLTKKGIRTAWTLAAKTPPTDLKQRIRLLRELQGRVRHLSTAPSGFKVEFKGPLLTASGPSSQFIGWNKPEDCIEIATRPLIEQLGFPRIGPVSDACLEPIALSPTTTTFGDAVLRFHLRDHKLVLEGSSHIKGRISDLFTSGTSHDLWLLNRDFKQIQIYDTRSEALVLKRTIDLPAGFEASRMIPHQNGKRVVLLAPPGSGRSFGLVDLENATWLGLKECPSHIDAIYASSWDPESQTLFLAVSTKGNRGEPGHGLLVYNTSGEQLSLRQLIDFPIGKTRMAGLSSLVFNTSNHLLYGLNTLQGMLQYFEVENGLVARTNGVLLDQLTLVSAEREPIYGTDPHQMALSRHYNSLVLLDFTDFSGKRFGDRVFLIDLDSTPPLVQSSLKIGNRPIMVKALPMGHHFLAITGQTPEIILFHQEGKQLVLDNKISFPSLKPRRCATGPLGEVIFLACNITEKEPKR